MWFGMDSLVMVGKAYANFTKNKNCNQSKKEKRKDGVPKKKSEWGK